MKYTITVGRKVQTYPYENLSVALTQEFDGELEARDRAFSEVASKVDGWIAEESRRVGPKSQEPRGAMLWPRGGSA